MRDMESESLEDIAISEDPQTPSYFTVITFCYERYHGARDRRLD